jgi:hypothetical protein
MGQMRKEYSLALTNGSCEVEYFRIRMQNNSFQGHKNYMCCEGESGIILCI